MTTTFEDLLAKAEKAPKRHEDVDVYLDGGDTSDRIAVLEQQLVTVKTDARMGDARPQQIEDEIAAVQAEAAGAVVTLRFRQMPAEEWAEITAHSPARVDVPVDRLYGYNVHDAAREAAPLSGVRLVRPAEGDPVEEDLTEEQWERLFTVIAGRDFGSVVDAVFILNDYGPQERLDAARKASRAGGGSTSN